MADGDDRRPESRQPGSRAFEVANILWPPPSRVSLGRWRSTEADEKEWLILPSLERPWWLLPAGRQDSAGALQRHDVGQRNGAAFRTLAALQARGILSRLPLARMRVHDPEHEGTIRAELTRILGRPVEVCVRLGRARVNRGLVLQALTENGQICAFVKMATTPSAGEALRQERTSLERVTALVGESVVCPRVLHFGPWHGNRLLVMSPLLGDRQKVESGSVPVAQMLAFARTTETSRERIKHAGFAARQGQLIEALPHGRGGRELRRAHNFLLDQCGDISLELGWWHGDWVPWNMGWDRGNIHLWDWEHFAEDVPVGWDLVHYLGQRLRNDFGTHPKQEVRWMTESGSLLDETLGLDAQQAFAVMLSYLIELNTRYISDRLSEDAEFSPREGWDLPFLARMTSGLTP